ncbi:MAG: amidohydrolase family protein, partial [Saprospiraceae bacterium]
LGLSTGLEYDPGIFSSKEEVMQLALVAARRDGRYISHIRSEDVNLESAVEEIIDIGRRTKMPVQISHIKIAMKKKWGKANDIVNTLNNARKEGINISADIYPYDFWLSDLEVQFPNRDFDNKASAEFALRELTPPDGMILSKYDANPTWVGKSIAEIAIEINKDPADTYMYLIRLAHDKKADESVMGRSMTEADIIALMQWPNTNICSDGFGGGRHPRGVGSFPRVLHHYVKELHAFTMEEAIRKMTLLSAEHMGIEHRGKIAHEYQADLVIIDPDRISDKSSLQDPFALSEGINGVWVNGIQVWKENKYLGQRPGKLVRNPRYVRDK